LIIWHCHSASKSAITCTHAASGSANGWFILVCWRAKCINLVRYLKTRLSRKDFAKAAAREEEFSSALNAEGRVFLFSYCGEVESQFMRASCVLMVFICFLLCRSAGDFVSLAVRCLNDLNYRLTSLDKKSNSRNIRINFAPWMVSFNVHFFSKLRLHQTNYIHHAMDEIIFKKKYLYFRSTRWKIFYENKVNAT
jgi:hypothetical protein